MWMLYYCNLEFFSGLKNSTLNDIEREAGQ